jgi:hypothetical protein
LTAVANSNGYTGEVVVEAGPHRLILRMRYRELATIRSEFGKEWAAQYQEALDGDAMLQAKFLAIMSGASVDEILDLSPPLGIVTMAEPLLQAFFVAQYGHDWRQKRAEVQEVEERKNPFLNSIRSLLGLAPPPTSASRPATSGE